MKTNPRRFQFMILKKIPRPNVALIVNSVVINESAKVVLQGLTIDNNETFEEHINNLC